MENGLAVAEVSYLSALGAGALSFLSPCVLPLVPPYLCYMAGVSVDQFRGEADKRQAAARRSVILSAFFFTFGFATVFVALGAGASTIGAALRQHAGLFAEIGGIVIIIMGLAFAFGWTPCIGPVLGAILGVAATRNTVGEGAFLLAAYSLGLAVPFWIAALFSERFMQFLQRFRKHLGKVEKVMGGLLVLTGVLFLTGGMASMSYWLLETFPALSQIG
jgi:cytochrome c-type biogenesis protein